MREKASQGICPGHAPSGYRNNKAERTIEIDPVDSVTLKRIFELYATGAHTLSTLVKTIYAERAGITKHITWHVFRHSYATMMKGNCEDVTTVQQSLRHANSRTSMDVYTQAIPETARAAAGKIAASITAAAQPEPMHAAI